MHKRKDSAPDATAQPVAGAKRSRITKLEARDRKNDAARVMSFLILGGAITRDRPKWRRASMSGDAYNAHVCERLLKQSRIVQIAGTIGTFRLEGPKA